MSVYVSNRRPDFTPFTIELGQIPAYQYQGTVASEGAAGRLMRDEALAMLEDMLIIREFEEMIVRLRSGAYEPLPNFNYRGPTHVSIGQEAVSVGACTVLGIHDNITSTHRGHGDSLAKGTQAIRRMSVEALRARVPDARASTREEWIEAALEDHLYRTIAELFGKDDGYCRGRGGSMHIADFRIGHLGANAIVGGGVPIATGAAMAHRYLEDGSVVCCFVGDGGLANGVVLESLNWAAQAQWTNHLAEDKPFGLPIIFAIQNNHYGMTHRTDDEVMGVRKLAQRGAGFANNRMHAEVVNGMDVLAVREAMQRAVDLCRRGQGPVLLEFDTYRYYGHSLSDPCVEYRTKDEQNAWRAIDPIETFKRQLIEYGWLDEEAFSQMQARVRDRNARMAVRAAESSDPAPDDVLKFMYTDTACEIVPAEYANVTVLKAPEKAKRDAEGRIQYKDAIREALIEEMMRDRRVIFYGEDVAEYGNAFKVTKGLLETFGRRRVFNTPISEACICGTAVGAAMAGLRPVVELMYMDFALMASDQIANQAAKWHYMSGGQTELPLVIRASVGGGKGYGGQHSQTLESVFAHIPGLYVVYPGTPYDAKGLLKASIRDNNPVLYVESQLLYSVKGVVPEDDYLVPLGQADIKRAGRDVTIVCWGPAVMDALKAAEQLKQEQGVEAEVVDIRCLVPLDEETILRSVSKTGRCVVASHAVNIGSFTAEIVSRIVEKVFDDLDAPVLRVGAKNGIAPQSHILEAAFYPNAGDIVAAVRKLL